MNKFKYKIKFLLSLGICNFLANSTESTNIRSLAMQEEKIMLLKEKFLSQEDGISIKRKDVFATNLGKITIPEIIIEGANNKAIIEGPDVESNCRLIVENVRSENPNMTHLTINRAAVRKFSIEIMYSLQSLTIEDLFAINLPYLKEESRNIFVVLKDLSFNRVQFRKFEFSSKVLPAVEKINLYDCIFFDINPNDKEQELKIINRVKENMGRPTLSILSIQSNKSDYTYKNK